MRRSLGKSGLGSTERGIELGMLGVLNISKTEAIAKEEGRRKLHSNKKLDFSS